MTDHQNANTERRPQRRGRASFVAVLDEVRKEHERGVPLVWIYEAFADRLEMGYTQFTKYVTRCIKQGQPILNSSQAEEICIPWVIIMIVVGQSAQTPGADRIEARDRNVPLRHQHPCGLTHGLVWMITEIQSMRQQH